MKELAPIALFTYNRLYETQATVKALQGNYLATESELFIFSDGAKDSHGEEKVKEVRRYLRTIEGFKNIRIKESQKNKGLANSIIDGVTDIIDQYGKVVVLEDDLVTSPNFLDFMNLALEFYAESPNIISISGYTLDLPSLNNYEHDYYVGYRASSWGWGTWKNRWRDIDWEVSDYTGFKKDYRRRLKFSEIGSDMPGMLRNQIKGKIDSWAIRFCYHQFKYGLQTVFAAKSKINHIGINENATHAVGAIRFNTPLDDGCNRSFEFNKALVVNKKITEEFRIKFSIKNRAIDKLRRTFKNFNIGQQ
ncbi:MAG: sugar transferase [Saonia sp.]